MTASISPTLLPDPTQLEVVALQATATEITAIVRTCAATSACPVCGSVSGRVHSRYVRQVVDVPWHEVAFRLQFHAQRFFCDQPTCPRAIFTERLPGGSSVPTRAAPSV